MSQLVSVSIDVTKIDKSKLIPGKKGTYLNIMIAINDGFDEYGNNVAVWEGQSKEEYTAKAPKKYLGNGRTVGGAKVEQAAPVAQTQSDDLPF